MKKIDKKAIFFIVILTLAIFIRMLDWPNMIKYVHVDEAMTAINAKTIADYGNDMYGTSYPVFFETWKWGGQTAFLTYFMALCIKILGFNIIAIRLPLLLLNIISIVIMYLFVKKITHNTNISLVAMFICAVAPWHIQQTTFALDCNTFPHIILIAIYILYVGIHDKKTVYIYLSMIFFAISMYTYGLSTYFVPTILVILAIYLLKKKQIKINKLFVSFIVYLVIATPILLFYLVNFFKLDTIKLGNMSIQYLPEFERMSDILFFSKDILLQFIKNIIQTVKILIFQFDGQVWNGIPFFGATYIVSILFFVYGIYWLNRNKEFCSKNKIGIDFIYIWLIASIGIGIFVKDITIYKINIIWYPILIIISIGIYGIANKNKKIYGIIFNIYLILLVIFIISFKFKYIKQINSSYFWDSGLVKAIKYLEDKDYDKILIADYNMYRYFERTKTFIRFATNYKVGDYNYEKTEEYDVQFTNKHRIISVLDIFKYNVEEYDACIVSNFSEIKEYFEKNNYHIMSSGNYLICEK